MEDLRKIKMLINRINKKCDLENKSIFEVLKNWEIDCNYFLIMIGLKKELITEDISQVINDLLQKNDTRITYNPGMESLDHDEIEFYSKSSNTYFGFVTNEAKANIENNYEQKEYFYHNFKYIANRIKNEILENISFSLKTIASIDEMKTRFVTNKYFLKHMDLEIKYEHDGKIEFFQVTINEDMIQKDLDYIINLLYCFNYKAAKMILERYPAELKIMSDNADLYNFNNR